VVRATAELSTTTTDCPVKCKIPIVPIKFRNFSTIVIRKVRIVRTEQLWPKPNKIADRSEEETLAVGRV